MHINQNQKSPIFVFCLLIPFYCFFGLQGDIVVDNGNARIVQRYMEFNVGIAYGTDHLLEPPDLGSRCDQFQTVEISVST